MQCHRDWLPVAAGTWQCRLAPLRSHWQAPSPSNEHGSLAAALQAAAEACRVTVRVRVIRVVPGHWATASLSRGRLTETDSAAEARSHGPAAVSSMIVRVTVGSQAQIHRDWHRTRNPVPPTLHCGHGPRDPVAQTMHRPNARLGLSVRAARAEHGRSYLHNHRDLSRCPSRSRDR